MNKKIEEIIETIRYGIGHDNIHCKKPAFDALKQIELFLANKEISKYDAFNEAHKMVQPFYKNPNSKRAYYMPKYEMGWNDCLVNIGNKIAEIKLTNAAKELIKNNFKRDKE